jgi:Ca-activated chloride channel family protein
MSNPEDQIFVVNFNERVTVGLPDSSPFTDNSDELQAAILKAPLAGETALYDAVDVGLRKLSAGNRDKKALIVISDGGDNASSTTFPWLLKKAAESNAMIYTVGIFDPADEDQNPGVLRKLSKETGGESFFPAKFEDAVADLSRIADEIRHQYTIGYVSTNPASGHHAVRVVANGFIVRTRTGYIK